MGSPTPCVIFFFLKAGGFLKYIMLRSSLHILNILLFQMVGGSVDQLTWRNYILLHIRLIHFTCKSNPGYIKGKLIKCYNWCEFNLILCKFLSNFGCARNYPNLLFLFFNAMKICSKSARFTWLLRTYEKGFFPSFLMVKFCPKSGKFFDTRRQQM